jgi:hypothetical protein
MIRKLNEKLIELRRKEKDLGCFHPRSNLCICCNSVSTCCSCSVPWLQDIAVGVWCGCAKASGWWRSVIGRVYVTFRHGRLSVTQFPVLGWARMVSRGVLHHLQQLPLYDTNTITIKTPLLHSHMHIPTIPLTTGISAMNLDLAPKKSALLGSAVRSALKEIFN